MSSDESRWALIKPRGVSTDGDRVAFRVSGQGPVLLLVHAMAGSSETWKHVSPRPGGGTHPAGAAVASH